MLATHLTAGRRGVRASAWRTLHQEGAGESVVVALGGGGGTFWQLSHLGDQDWENIRNTIKGANEKDKAKRTA